MVIFLAAAFWRTKRRILSATGLLATAASMAMVGGVFAIRWIDQDKFPLQSRYETFLMVLLGLGIGMLLFAALAGLPGKTDTRAAFCNAVCAAGGFIGVGMGMA